MEPGAELEALRPLQERALLGPRFASSRGTSTTKILLHQKIHFLSI